MDLRVKFDAENTWTWQWLDDDRDLRRIEAEARILSVIEYLGEAYASDIAEKLSISCTTVYSHLKRMRRERKIEWDNIEKTTGNNKTNNFDYFTAGGGTLQNSGGDENNRRTRI